MKKYAILLLLLALCLSLTACELPFELPFDLPFLNNQGDTADYTEVYSHMEGKSYCDAMEALCRLQQGLQGAPNMVSDEVAAKYAELGDMIKAGNYTAAAKYIAETAFNDYLRLPDDQAPAWRTMEAGWFELSGNPHFEKESYLSFYENGRFSTSRDEGDMVWIVKEYTATQLDIEIYYIVGLQSAGFVRYNVSGTGEPEMRYTYQNRVGENVQLQYVRDWLLTGAFRDWQTPEQSEEFPAEFSLDGSQAVIAGERYPFVRNENGEMQIMKEDGSVWFTARLNMGEERYTLELENHWTRCTYYAPGEDYDYGKMVYHYERALNILPSLKDCDHGLDYNGDVRSQQEWFAYVYSAMENAKKYGYGDSEKILKNFTMVEGLLVDITTEPDNLNGHVQPYKYDSQGRLIYAWDESLTLFIYGTPVLPVLVDGYDDFYEEAPHQYYFEYNARGRISRILHKDRDRLISTITPTYEANGNIKRLDILMANGETRKADFTYDSDLMPRSMGSELFIADDSVLRSISYGEYFLDFAWTPDPNGYILTGIVGWINYHGQDASYTEEYTYENGYLTSKVVTTAWGEGGIYSTMHRYLYTCDAAGRIASHHKTTFSGDNSWENTFYYIYQDVFFYDYDPKDNQDEEQINKILAYEKAMDVLTLLKTCGDTLTFEGETKTQQEWLAFVRQAMTDAAGYGESNRILANFSQLENVLVGVSPDPNGGSFVKEYGYDAAGRLIFANDNYYTKYLYCTLELPVTPHYYFEYDAQNRVSRIIHKNGDALYATFTLTYNDRGQVKRMDIVMADGQERYATFTYTGDMMPRYINEEDYEDDFGELDENAFNVLNCISHGEMFMDFAWTPDFDGYTYSGMSFWFPVSEEEWLGYSEHVEYDDQDRRIKKTIWLDDEVDTVITYAYDADSRLISETHTAADGQTTTYYYIYQNILVYNFDAQ